MKSTIAIGALLLAWTAAAEAATIVPHRAIYDLSLLRTGQNSPLQSANGRLAFEVEGSVCEGWTASFRMATRYRQPEGETTLIDTQTTSYEGPGGLDFRHQLKEFINGVSKQDMAVKMTKPGKGAEGTGEISAEQTTSFTVPAEASLPMEHQLKLMTLGEQGGGRDSSLIFDGSDGAKYFRAISFVGKEKKPGSIARDASNPAAEPLKAIGAWPMTISYYAADGETEVPEYQVSFDMYENGVATGLVLDYGDFALSGTLKELKMLEAATCP